MIRRLVDENLERMREVLQLAQEGKLDLRGRTIDCRHYYDAPAGETVCARVPM